MPHSLVTGGAGFIGSHLTDYLIEQLGHHVVVLDDLSGGTRENVHPRAEFVEGSIVNHELVDALFRAHQFEYVYHLAAYAAEGLSHFIKRFNYANNVIGSVNLLNAAVNTGTRVFVFTSSIAVYGANQLPMTEDLTPLPEDSYGIAKLAVERELKVSHEMFGLDYVIFRPHNVYGERQNIGDKYRNVIGIFMNRLMQEQELVIFGDGAQRRAFTYVGDIVPAIAECVQTPDAWNQIFNIGAEEHYSINELAALVCEAMEMPGHVRHVAARNEVQVAYADHSKLRRVFPNLPQTDLATGLRRMAQWAKRAGSRPSAEFQAIEIYKNLPPVWLESNGVGKSS
jgi:UDP-glucose 4-epimerase